MGRLVVLEYEDNAPYDLIGQHTWFVVTIPNWVVSRF
jgi:hypothetical protein